MDILVNVANQKLKIATNLKSLVAGTQEFVRFVFNLTGDWDNLMTFAQFSQNGVSYNQYLDEDNSAYLPAEIGVGTCTLMLYGSNENTIATTNYLTLSIDENILVNDANSTDISESLYTQLVTKVNALTTWNEQNAADLIAVDTDLQRQINTKAAQSDLTTEISRAKAAEKANADAIALKANQTEVDQLTIKVTQLESNEVVAQLIQEAVQNEMAEFLASGSLANMTIQDGSITRSKVDSDFNDTLTKADNAMQPSVYDPQNLKVDIYAYAQGRADTVQNNLNTVKSEIQDAYKLTDTLIYTKLGDAIRGAVTLSRSYAQALLADYKAFTIKVVDELPITGESMTFYLVPNRSNTGYDKYWWITDSVGDAKWDVFGSSSTLVVTELPATGEEDVDYILKSSAGCLYYKWIDDMWQVVAGSIANVSSTLPTTGNAFTDYYVLNDSGSYVHYRYINGNFHAIGSDAYTKDEINEKIAAVNANLASLEQSVEGNAQQIEANATNISAVSRAVDNVRQDLNNLDVEGYTYYASYGKATLATGDEADNVFTLFEVKDDVENVKSQFVIAGGGGGGNTSTTNLVVERITTSPLILTTTDKAEISFSYSSTDSDGDLIDGTYTWKLGNTVISTGALVQGVNTFDMSEYVNIGTQKFTLTVVDAGGSVVVKSWTVQMVDVRIESSFSDKVTYDVGKAVNFTYTPYGAVPKTVHFILDGVELESVTTSTSGTLQSYSIPAQTHGAHLFECYITATINNISVETEHIFKDIIWFDKTSDTPVIGCIYRYDHYGKVSAKQYDSTNIPIYVFDPKTSTPTIIKKVNEEIVATQVLSGVSDIWTYKTATIGEHTLVVSCKNVSITIVIDIEELGIDVAPITANLAFDFNPTGLSNSAENKLWEDVNTGVNMSVSDNFDWANGGYQLDNEGNQFFRVKAGTTATINYNLFGTDPTTAGSHFKAIFKTENVRDIDATWLTCVADPTAVGLEMKVHEANLMSSTDTLNAPYSEEDVIEFEYDIQTLDTDNVGADSTIMIYEDGVAYRPMIYNSTHRLYQYSPVAITIGSADCDVCIYRMKAYTASLTDSNILSNFIADAVNAEEMIARYNRNQIYNENNILTPESVANACPNLRVIKIDAPYFTNNKSESVDNTTIQCIYKNGDAVLDNWTARNCQHSGQGTTSNEYGVAGRNMDCKMNRDNTEITLGDGTTYSNGTGKVSLTRNSVPNNYFNIKVNIASSENANNSVLANRYDRFLPYETPAKRRDSKVKTTMEFVNCVVFIRENNSDLSTHREFNDTEWHFYGIGNIGDSKKTDKTRANDKDDTKEFVNEILDNTLSNSIFDTGVVNLIVESLPTTGNLFTDYYVKNSDGTYKHSRYLNNTWITVSNNVPKIQNGAVSIVSSVPEIGEIDIEYYVKNADNTYSMYIWNGSSFSEGVIKTEIDNGHMANSISAEQWVAGNTKYDSLYADAFDGDSTNEFRYEHKQVTPEQHQANIQVWRDMYKWVITATDEEFINEVGDWFIEDSLTYFYLFTERYTMSDNRAKNSFWHWSKIYLTEEEATGAYADVAEFYEIDNAKAAINNGYRFDFWDYDNDTALGINNSGELKMTYGKEDIDYQIDGDPSSGYIFNGAESVIFRRVRLLMHDKLVAMYQNRESAGAWNPTTTISEFDNWQSQFPEELWRLDIQRKYIRPYLGVSVDNSIPKDSDRFLRTMLNGRKKYQRRQFERDQAIYMGTKYLSSSIMADQIMFRCNTPQSAVVTPNYTLTIIPYSDMYLSVKFGNTTPHQIRAKAGKTYSVECPLETMDDTAILIYAASRIQELNDLSACYIHDNDFSNASKLKVLILGNTTPGYSNGFLTTLTLGNNALLEELDLRNCSNLSGSLNLSNCGNLVKLFAEGTAITGVVFATNGKIQIAHLPDTINSLTMRNLHYITDLQVSYDVLEALTIENSDIDEYAIILDAVDTLQTLRLVGIDWVLSDTTLLNQILKMNNSYLSGSVFVSGQVRNQELVNYSNKWNDLEVTYNPENLVTQYLVTYVNSDNKSTVLFTTYVDRGDLPPDPYSKGLIPIPTLDSDAEFDYSFGETTGGSYIEGSGWEGLTDVVLSNCTITAKYTKTKRKYTVTWYSRQGLSLGSKVVEYGSDVEYEGDTPVNSSEEGAYIYNVFAGWNKNTGYVRENTDVYAVWDRAELPMVGKDLKNMTPGEIFAVTSSGRTENYFEQKDYYDITLGHDFDFENVESKILAKDVYLDGTQAINTDIKLFGENSPSFTLAIDFRFTDTTNTNNTLISCFEEDGSEGFRLRMNNNPDIQWGDKNINVGCKGFRDIVVIRHRAGDDKLYVYSSNGSSTSFANAVSRAELVRNRSTSTEQTLTLGAIRFMADGGFDDYGSGYLYWAKVWFDDLGDSNALKLAAWSHEVMRVEYCGTGRYRLANGTSQSANASFIANALLTDRLRTMNPTATNTGGWDACKMRTFINNRMPNALPTAWRTMLKEVKISASEGNKSTNILVSNDFFYIPAYIEMGGSGTTYISEGSHISWFTSDIRRAKFRGMFIPDDATYYTDGSDPSLVSTNNVTSGDVWKQNGNSTCYIYATDEEVAYYGLSKSIEASIGGYWVSAYSWWERSPLVGNTIGFWYVYTNGSNNYSYGANSSYGVCPCFSI